MCGLLLTALFGGIDPHGAGNTAFLWHSSMGIALYLLSISRVLSVGHLSTDGTIRPMRRVNGEDAHRGLQIAFYALLLALPISGWFLASEEGTSAHLLGIPALPQWYFQEAAQQSTAVRAAHPSEAAPGATSLVVNLEHEVIELEIKVLGSGCSKCRVTIGMIERVARDLGVAVEITKVQSAEEIQRHGIRSTPAVIVDDEIVHSGGLPSRDKVQGWLQPQPHGVSEPTDTTSVLPPARAASGRRRCPRPPQP